MRQKLASLALGAICAEAAQVAQMEPFSYKEIDLTGECEITGLDEISWFTAGSEISLGVDCLDQDLVMKDQVKLTFQRQKHPYNGNFLTEESHIEASLAKSWSSPSALLATVALNQIGDYKIRLLVNGQVIDEENSLTVTSDLCISNAQSGSADIYLCPGTSICTSSYFNCDNIDDRQFIYCYGSTPFLCADDSCVADVMTDCCGVVDDVQQYWCPHSKSCVSDASTCCSLSADTPIYCQDTQSCVANPFDCCSNYLSSTLPMVKCSYEDKCVEANTSANCFVPFSVECSDSRFPYQCPNDGVCRKDASQCPSAKVCPPGYFQCPDDSCLPGEDQISLCDTLTTCIVDLPFTDTTSQTENLEVGYIRCLDGKTCVNSFDDCPTEISCLQDGYVQCPDGSCQKNSYACVQPPTSADDNIVDPASCGPMMMRCPNGQCSPTCSGNIAVTDCNASGQVLCARTLTCADTYAECTSGTYCPHSQNFSLLASAFLCGDGPEICVQDREQCQSTACSSPKAYFTPEATSLLPYENYDPQALRTCPDGRCMMNGLCMTAFQCSSAFIKAGGFGLFCVQDQAEALKAANIALPLNSQTCLKSAVMCLTGQCRATIQDCPQDTTCPADKPVQCQDGQCQTSSEACQKVDTMTQINLNACLVQNLLLCVSDHYTCQTSQHLCPTLSTCPFGFMKCSESVCINPLTETCPSTSTCSDISKPYFCRESLTCVGTGYDLCPEISYCDITNSVKCASDGSCRQSIALCPSINTAETNKVPIIQVETENETCTTDQFDCDGTCSDSPCSEWTDCPSGQTQCTTGQCVTDLATCPDSSTGCPFYYPYRCEYSANCVAIEEDCVATSEQLDTACQTNFPGVAEVGCSLEGNCVSEISECATTYELTCYDWMYPNTIKSSTTGMSSETCYVPSCPDSVPIKCENGLCVTDTKYCPSVEAQITDSIRCNILSVQSEQGIQVPCIDGSCVDQPDQCLPVYDCDLNSVEKFRCSDGSCKASQSDCAQLQQSCPDSSPYRCDNGMCASEENECLKTNGCPVSAAQRCDSTGICIQQANTCFTPFQLFTSGLSLSLGDDNLCARQSQVPCFGGDGVFYCADSISECYLSVNNCPANQPILCDGKCEQYQSNCSAFSVSQTNSEQKGELGCPISTPYRCSLLDYSDCKALPYTSYETLFDQACSTQLNYITSIDNGNIVQNACINAVTPFPCGDGSCLEYDSSCRTCSYFCREQEQCVASYADCELLTNDARAKTLSAQMQQICPSGAPYRCIRDGLCVISSIVCDIFERTEFNAQIYNMTHTGTLIDSRCPFSRPIRCIDGSCAENYSECFANVDKQSTAFTTPIAWGATFDSDVTDPCQVYCQDGSCRDRQENCPLLLGCSDPLRPTRCHSGFCAQDLAECLSLYDTDVQEEAAGQPSAICSSEASSASTSYFRCEDGVCRPGILNSSGEYESNCLSYIGCGLVTPYQCPNGVCAATKEDCLTSSVYCSSKTETPYQCKNFECVASPQECSLNVALITPVQIEYNLNLLEEVTIDFAYRDFLSVARLVLPPDSVHIDSVTALKQAGYEKLRFLPIPTDQLDSISNVLDSSYYPMLEPYFVINSVTDTTGQLSNAASIITPLVNIVNTSQDDQTFQNYPKLEFYIDATSFNADELDLTNDFCLAKANTSNQWECTTRDFEQLNDGFWSFSISEMGIYSIIVNPLVARPGPDPTPTPFDPEEECTAASGVWDADTETCFAPTPTLSTKEECETAGGVWDADTETCTDPTPTPFDPQEECEAAGGVWDADTEICTDPTPTPDPEEECEAAGKVWDADTQTCNDPTPTPTPDTEEECIAAGGVWDADTETCSDVPSGSTGGEDYQSFFADPITYVVFGSSLLLLIIIAIVIYWFCCREAPKERNLHDMAIDPLRRRNSIGEEVLASSADFTEADEIIKRQKLEQLLLIKSNEVNKLESQLQSLKVDHDEKLVELDRQGASDKQKQDLIEQYNEQVKTLTREAQTNEKQAYKRYKTNMFEETENGGESQSQLIQVHGVQDEHDSDTDSFNSDQEGQIAELDNKMTNLTNKYVSEVQVPDV